MNRKAKSGRVKRRQLVLRIVVIVLLSLFLGFSIYSINARRVMKNMLPMPFGVGTSVVLSGSMEPTLSVNDLIFVRGADSYQTGDVIVYQTGYELIIHRIVACGVGEYVTQGDANNAPDPPVAAENVKGKLLFAIPYLGLLVRGLQTVPGILIVLLLAILLMRRSWRREKDASDEELNAIKDEIRQLKAQMEEQTPPDPAPEAEEAK